MKARSLALVAAMFLGSLSLGGCADAIMLGYQAVSAATLVATSKPPSFDGDLTEVKLPHKVSTASFSAGVRKVAISNGYSIMNMNEMPTASGNIVMAMLAKHHRSYIPFGKNWNVSVTLTLHADGKTIEISPRVQGDGPSVKEISDTLKSGLLEKFA